jgi:hypothetical protein
MVYIPLELLPSCHRRLGCLFLSHVSFLIRSKVNVEDKSIKKINKELTSVFTFGQRRVACPKVAHLVALFGNMWL